MINDEYVWAVGGQVRDRALGRETHDYDYAVEGSAIQFATELGHKHGYEVKLYPSFNTATVFTGNRHLDFASCRRESYRKPGKMPSCDFFQVGIREDLLRRDFTVNAIAQNTKSRHYVAVPNAWHDLETRQLRVLHENSFVDDPTRMLRAIRYAVSLDFKIERYTEDLFDNSLLETISKGRLERHVGLGWREEHWELAARFRLDQTIRRILGWPTSNLA